MTLVSLLLPFIPTPSTALRRPSDDGHWCHRRHRAGGRRPSGGDDHPRGGDASPHGHDGAPAPRGHDDAPAPHGHGHGPPAHGHDGPAPRDGHTDGHAHGHRLLHVSPRHAEDTLRLDDSSTGFLINVITLFIFILLLMVVCFYFCFHFIFSRGYEEIIHKGKIFRVIS